VESSGEFGSIALLLPEGLHFLFQYTNGRSPKIPRLHILATTAHRSLDPIRDYCSWLTFFLEAIPVDDLNERKTIILSIRTIFSPSQHVSQPFMGDIFALQVPEYAKIESIY
jgi:hypothetical protein